MYLKGQKLVEIASQLNLPEGTVRRWKSTHKWDSERSDKKSERSYRKRGGQPGNDNAVGHGGTGPPGNKNAVTTGEFETLLFDCLEEDEKQLAESVQLDKEQLLLQEIQLLTVRERRMLKRIQFIRDSVEYLENGEPVADMTLISRKAGIEKDKETDLKEYRGKLGQIQAIEDALTRVQAQKQRAIETLHRFGYDDARLEAAIDEQRARIAQIKTQTDKLKGTDNDAELKHLDKVLSEIKGVV